MRSIPAGAGKPKIRLISGRKLTRRSIPAGAGKPASPMARPARRRGLSPRVRGSRRGQAPPGTQGRRRGLSPRVRGSPRLQGPAAQLPQVYPRGCGEARREYAAARASVRGSQFSPLVAGVGLGSIPAGAGKPLAPVMHDGDDFGSIPAGAGKPRVLRINCPPVPLRGLSPRVRGSHIGASVTLRRHRRVYPRGCGEAESRPARGRWSGGVYPRGCGEAATVAIVALE